MVFFSSPSSLFSHFFPFALTILLSACVDPTRPKTPHQRNLESKAFEELSAPIEDPDYVDIGFEEVQGEEGDSDDDLEEKIDQKFYKNISVSVDETMKMREILTQMADTVGVNIFIAQDISGSISFSAKDRPFIDILRDICSSAGLKYNVTGSSVKIEVDSPTLKIYKIPSLNLQRDTQSSVAISTDIFNGNMASSGGINGIATGNNSGNEWGSGLNASQGHNNGSNSIVSETSRSDFWIELENALKMIVGQDDGSCVSIHKQGGIITAYTTQAKHEEIKKYLKMLKESSEQQVLIEAKILEVNLKDEYKSGINWDIARKNFVLNRGFSTEGTFAFGLSYKYKDKFNPNVTYNEKALFGFLETFGAVKTISSPRITILNNHSAVLKVARNEVVYFPEFQKQYTGRNSDNTMDLLSTNVKTIPIGLIMKVQPSIDRRDNSIILSLRPTISKTSGEKEVPFLFNNYAPGTDNNAIKSVPQSIKIPVVDVREFDSVLKVSSGQVAVMGGLMEDRSHNKREGIPGLMNNPLDLATGDRNRSTDVTELVIFLRATILRKKTKKHHKADEKIYKMFSTDPRQLNFKK